MQQNIPISLLQQVSTTDILFLFSPICLLSSLVVIGGAIPMLFVSYTAAPFVNQVFLSLPGFAQQSTMGMQSYLRSVPRTATLGIETMKFNFYPKRTVVSISDLAPTKSMTRPVSFMNTHPQSRPWWQGKESSLFYTPEKNPRATSTKNFHPEVWEQVFSQIKNNPVKNT